MKNTVIILLKRFLTNFVKFRILLSVMGKCKNFADFHCFDIFTPHFIKINTEFIPSTYNYGKNYPRSGIK